MKKANDIKDLNAKEQWVLRHVLKTGNFNGTLRFDWKFVDTWFNRFDKKENLNPSRTFDRIEAILKKMIERGIIAVETIYLSPSMSPTQKRMYPSCY